MLQDKSEKKKKVIALNQPCEFLASEKNRCGGQQPTFIAPTKLFYFIHTLNL